MNKKIIAVILSIVLVLGITSFVVIADTSPNITVGSGNATAGDSVSVDVEISNNPGINTFSLGFDYDTTRLNLTNVEVASDLGGQFQYSKKAVWLNSKDTSYNGKILTLTFSVLSNASAGDASVVVTYNKGDISNYNEDDVDFQLVAGKITVSSGNVNPPASDKGQFSISNASAKQGETVSVKVSIDKNPGINTFSLGFNYETANLELTNVEVASALGGQFQYSKKAVWLNSKDTTYTGEILTLTFKVLDNASLGDTAVSVLFNEGDISNYDEEDVDFDITAGKIRISEKTVTPPVTTDTSLIVSAQKGKIGQTVKMTVSLEKSDSVKSIAISGINYNSSVLELVSGKWLLSDGIIQDFNVTNKTAAITFADNIDANKAILELSFKVKNGATDGDYNVTVSATAKHKEQNNSESVININNGIGIFSVYSYIIGDVNGDEIVTSDDAVHLLYHTLLPDTYTVNQDCDFNYDGYITSDDAVYLLYYTLLPDTYPIG